jgi:hypothetical protein
MLIKILRGTVVGGQRVAAETTVEASYADAKYLINTGKAEEAKPKPARRKKPKADTADV